MEETIAIRSQLAKLLGYRHHSDFVLDIRMAKKFETVRDFLEDLKVKLRVLGEKDYKSLLALKKQECKENDWDFDGKLHIWDVKYYNTMQIKNDLQVDQHKISQYFPLSRILSQAMAFTRISFLCDSRRLPTSRPGMRTSSCIECISEMAPLSSLPVTFTWTCTLDPTSMATLPTLGSLLATTLRTVSECLPALLWFATSPSPRPLSLL